MDNYKNLSKFISLVLRHKPDAAEIQLDKHGWADTIIILLHFLQKYIPFFLIFIANYLKM